MKKDLVDIYQKQQITENGGSFSINKGLMTPNEFVEAIRTELEKQTNRLRSKMPKKEITSFKVTTYFYGSIYVERKETDKEYEKRVKEAEKKENEKAKRDALKAKRDFAKLEKLQEQFKNCDSVEEFLQKKEMERINKLMNLPINN